MFVIVHLQHYVYCIVYVCATGTFTVYLRTIFHNHSSDKFSYGHQTETERKLFTVAILLLHALKTVKTYDLPVTAKVMLSNSVSKTQPSRVTTCRHFSFLAVAQHTNRA